MRPFISGVFSSPIKTFLLLATLFGSLLIILTPPFTGADEEAHFTRAYSITTGNFILHDSAQVAVPKSLRQTIGCFQTKTSQPGIMYRYDYSNYGESKRLSFACALNLPLELNNTEEVHTSAFAYSAIAYLPQIITILVGKLLHLPIVVMVYLIRFSVLIEYVVLISLAIRLLPIRKWALAGIALLPSPIMFINNPGGDHILLGSTALIMAIVIRSVSIPANQLVKENKWLLTALTVSTVVAVLSKGIFPGICLLPLIVFYRGLRYKKYYKLAIISSAVLLGVLWQKFGVNQGLASQTMPPSILEFPEALLKTFFYRWVDTDFLHIGDIVSHIPVNGEHLGMPSVIITLIGFLFWTYLLVSYPEKYKLRIDKKIAISLKITTLLCAMAIIAGSFAALFIGAPYLQVGSETIRGVQVRYLYPAFILLATTPLTNKIHTNEKTMANIVGLGSSICLSALILLNILKYQWIHF